MVRLTYRYVRPLSVLYARALGPYEQSTPAAWAKMAEWLEKHNARRLTKRVGQLEAVYLAACAYADDPSDANATRYLETLEHAREQLGTATEEGEESRASVGQAAD